MKAIVDEPQLRGRHQPMETVRVTARFFLSAKAKLLDWDNLMARCKWPIDFLKERGLIVDDGPTQVVWTGIPTQQHGRPPRLELTIEEVV